MEGKSHMLSILLLSEIGEGYELYAKLKSEGHVVKVWVKDTQRGTIYPWKTVDRYERVLETTDLVLSTQLRTGGIAAELRRRGKPVVGNILDESAFSLGLSTMVELVPEETFWHFHGMWNGEDWICKTINLMYDRLLNKDRGPKVGCTGTICKRLGQNDNIDQVLTDLGSLFKAMGYHGMVCVGFTQDGKPTYVNIGVTSVLLPGVMELVKENLGETLYKVATGQYLTWVPTGDISVSVAVMDMVGVPKCTLPVLKHNWEVLGRFERHMVCARGRTMREARRRVYRTLSTSVPCDFVYRTDIGAEYEESSVRQVKESVAGYVPEAHGQYQGDETNHEITGSQAAA